MVSNISNEQTYTLAAVFQAAKLVQNIARGNDVAEHDLANMLKSTLITSPNQTLDVYGGDLAHLTLGLTTLLDQLGNQNKHKDPELTRYIVSLLALERKLMKKPKLLKTLSERIEQAQRQCEHYDITSETLLASLASIYSDVISPMGAKIQVNGNPDLLKQSMNQNKIRALLLAGIRSAVLWRQVGGKRRNIIFARTKILARAQEILTRI